MLYKDTHCILDVIVVFIDAVLLLFVVVVVVPGARQDNRAWCYSVWPELIRGIMSGRPFISQREGRSISSAPLATVRGRISCRCIGGLMIPPFCVKKQTTLVFLIEDLS